MNDDRSLDRAARSWLESGPNQAPDSTVQAALARIQTTRQERGLALPRRLPTMFTNRLAAAALALVLVVLGGGFAVSRFAGPGTGGPSATPTAPPSSLIPSSNPSPSPAAPMITTASVGSTLPAGTYQVDGFAVPFSITLPAGWTIGGFTRNNISIASRADGTKNIGLIALDTVYHDPCKPLDGGEVVFGPGSGIDERLDAFSSMKDFAVTDVLGSILGGAQAKAFTIRNSIDLAVTSCSGNTLPIGTYDDSGTRTEIAMFGGESDRLWLVDVSGTIVLVAITNTPSIVDATKPLLDSISFGR